MIEALRADVLVLRLEKLSEPIPDVVGTVVGENISVKRANREGEKEHANYYVEVDYGSVGYFSTGNSKGPPGSDSHDHRRWRRAVPGLRREQALGELATDSGESTLDDRNGILPF